MESLRMHEGDCLNVLKTLPSESINCCVTSYYGLRDYGTGTWIGGNENCPHMRLTKTSENTKTGHKSMFKKGHVVGDAIYKSKCSLCGAIRDDKQIGLEGSPEEYVTKIVAIFREVKRILRNDGTLWVNLGDSYNGSGGSHKDCHKNDTGFRGRVSAKYGGVGIKYNALKSKDLLGIPWRVAFALQNDGWYLRQDIIWHKPNAMPESVKDRCTKAHEYIFLLTKSDRYYFDSEAIRERCSDSNVHDIMRRKNFNNKSDSLGRGYNNVRPDLCRDRRDYMACDFKRNKRSVWSITTKPYKGAHFATFPTKLIEPCILAGCPENGIVLDPFMGSGTTLLVALKYSRKSIGIELNPEYIELAKKRIYPEISQCKIAFML